MAKKAKRKAEEEAEAAFEFPEFDERGFLAHEFEQFYATVLAFALGFVVGAVAYLVGTASPSFFLPLGVGVVGTAAGAFAIRRIRPGSSEYTRGDWATLILLIFFGFLGFWLLLADLLRA